MLEGIARAAGDGAGRASVEGVAVAAGPPLGHIAAVIAKSSVFVGNDSGPLHIAAALGVPVVGIYGPTNEVRTAPYGPGHTVLTATVACRPCYAFGERFSCELDQVLCLELIDVDTVLDAVKAKLGQAARP
jgi:heptosyltransferase I